MKILAYLVVVIGISAMDISKVKDKFDRKRLPFSFKYDYWPHRWDDILRVAAFATGGFFLEAVVINWVASYFFKFDLDASTISDVAATFILCALFGWIGYKKA